MRSGRRRAVPITLILTGLTLGVALSAFAQHAIDPEEWIEMRKMFREQGPAPTIEQDVAALRGPEAERAGPRLIDRGPDVLPAVHAALLAPDVEPQHALRLLQVMGALGEEASVPVVLDLLGRDPGSPLRRDALLVLASLPATDPAAAFVSGIASDAREEWRTRGRAYAWFGFHRDPRGRPFAEALRADADPERRAAGLHVLARLGDASVLDSIGQMLAAGSPANSRDVLLLGLAEVATPEEFLKRAPASLEWSSGYKDALLWARYRAAPDEARPPICLEMLRSQLPGQMAQAVRCLLESGHADDLRPMAALDMEVQARPALVRNQIRKAGWSVIDTDTEFRIVPGPSSRKRP